MLHAYSGIFNPLPKNCYFQNFAIYFDQKTIIIKRHSKVYATCYSKFWTSWMTSWTLLYITVHIFEYISWMVYLWVYLLHITVHIFECMCVCLFPSTVETSPDWNKTNVMPEITSAMLCWGNYSVSRTFIATS